MTMTITAKNLWQSENPVQADLLRQAADLRASAERNMMAVAFAAARAEMVTGANGGGEYFELPRRGTSDDDDLNELYRRRVDFQARVTLTFMEAVNDALQAGATEQDMIDLTGLDFELLAQFTPAGWHFTPPDEATGPPAPIK